jgi:hypothetical protein
VSLIEPNDAGGEEDRGVEVADGLVVSGCDGAELLEPGKEALDQVALVMEMVVVLAAQLAVGL